VAFFPGNFPETSMARAKNLLKTEEITLSLNTQTVWHLERLVETGLYGNNPAEAAKVVIYDHCKLLIAQGKLKDAPPIPGSAAITVADATGTPAA
jgi:hypothetical protein